MTIPSAPLDLGMLLAFAALGLAVVGGLLLQVIAIVRQRRNIIGLMVKLAAIFALIAALAEVRTNTVPYLFVFFVAAVTALGGASLARRTLLR